METIWIGTGHNPDGPDLPLGLGMLLAQEPRAMAAYGQLSNQQKSEVIAYIQASQTGEQASERIATTVRSLRDGRELPKK